MKTSINFQKTMNTYLTQKHFRLAYKSFLKMNELRVLEGKEFLSMPNLQSKFEA